MKYSGWDYLDHMVQTCDELLHFRSTLADE